MLADLEDTFLKKNIPGRYSSWTEENDDKKHCNAEDISDSETDDEFYFQGLTNSSNTTNPSPPVQQPQIRQSGNTGVKGVLADYREAQQLERLAKEEDNLEKLEALYNATHPTIRKPEHTTTVKDKQICSDDDSSSDDLDDSDNDDEFLKRFRNQRIAELQQQQQQSKSTTTSKQLQTFGTLSLVTPQEYVQIVDDMDNTASSHYLIVHLYHSTIHTCQMLQSSLEKLSHSMIHTQFIQVNALEANANLDMICLPAILIYSKGELVHNLVRFTDDLPKRFSVDDVRQVLVKLLGIDD